MMTSQLHLWLERIARAFVDLIAVQAVGMLALLYVASQASSPPTEAALAQYYVHTFLPVSFLFPAVHSVFGLYTRLRGYTLRHKLRSAALSASVGTLLIVFVSYLSNRTQSPRSAAVLFGLGAISTAVGLRWMKDWLFHRETELGPSRVEVPEAHHDTVLVIGGAGYIGSLITEKLLVRGHRVKLLDSLLYGKDAIDHLLIHPGLEFIHGDCRNIQDVVRAMSGIKHVIHLAAIVGDPACAEDAANAWQINYAATRMILEIARGHAVERFLFASSCSVYGASDIVMDEKSETVPLSLYAEAKLQSENVLLQAKSRSFHPVILRFATVFGLAPRPRFDLVVNLLTAKAIQDGVITIYNGDQWRPFIHVRDIAAAVVDVLGAPLESVSGEILNIGDDQLNFTLGEVAEKIRACIPQTRVEYVENADRRNYRVSFKKIGDCIGFAAQHTIEEGILEIKRAFERGEILNYRQPFYSNVSYLKQRGPVEAKSDLDVKVMAAFAGTSGSRQFGPAAKAAAASS